MRAGLHLSDSTIQGRIERINNARTQILLNHERFHETFRNLGFFSVYSRNLVKKDLGSDVGSNKGALWGM